VQTVGVVIGRVCCRRADEAQLLADSCEAGVEQVDLREGDDDSLDLVRGFGRDGDQADGCFENEKESLDVLRRPAQSDVPVARVHGLDHLEDAQAGSGLLLASNRFDLGGLTRHEEAGARNRLRVRGVLLSEPSRPRALPPT
jgi:hypothetical protein